MAEDFGILQEFCGKVGISDGESEVMAQLALTKFMQYLPTLDGNRSVLSLLYKYLTYAFLDRGLCLAECRVWGIIWEGDQHLLLRCEGVRPEG